MRTMMWVLAFALLSGGCVSKKKYNALADELAASQSAHKNDVSDRDAKLTKHGTRIKTLEQALGDEQARVGELEAEMALLQEAVERLTSEKATLLKDRSRLAGSLDEMKQALAELEKRKAQTEARMAEYRQLMSKFKALIDAGKLKIKIVDGRMLVEMATDILFASGSASLSRDGRDALAEVAEVLASLNKRWQVAGHTDNDPIHTERFPSNWELAAARAIGVTSALIKGGVPDERISAASYAEFQPIASNDNRDGKSANRRIEIVMVPDLSDLPGYSELNEAAE